MRVTINLVGLESFRSLRQGGHAGEIGSVN
jgi:hypothetical protein